MHLKRAVAIFLAICIFASCFTSCKEKEPVLLHADEVALAEKCEHKFSTAEEKNENCMTVSTFVCELCSGMRTEYKPLKGHKVVFDAGKPPTCRNSGYSHGILCETCDKTYSVKQFTPLNINAHYFIDDIKPATLMQGEQLYSKCVFCSKSELISTKEELLASEKVGVPVLFFEGDLEASTKEKPVNMTLKYQSEDVNFTAYCTMKVQGNTSAEYEKKNYNIKLYEDEAHTKKHKVDLGWGEQFKYCLKANYIDASHARNIVNARLFAKITKSRVGHSPILDSLPNMGLVDGYPVALYLNGSFYGMYTLNIPKDKWLLGMKNDETVKQAILMADDWLPSVYLKEPIAIDYSNGWDLEHCTTQNSAWARNSFNRFIEFINTADDTEFKENLQEYIDVDSFIDTILFYIASGAYDNYVKNMLYVTYDGGDTWMCIPYDLDSTWGLYWDGSYFVSTDIGMPEGGDGNVWFKKSTNILFPKILSLFKDKVKQRYTALRAGVMSNDSIKAEFNSFFDLVPEVLYESDNQRWPSKPQKSIDQKKQIFEYLDARLTLLDNFINTY